VLRRAGAAIRKLLRQRDFAARVGGDEFVVILPNTDLAEGRLVADRIRRQVGDDLAPWGVTASLGLSSLVAEARLAVLAADGALYAAKSAGRDCVRAP
jgi:diguanylate cyclase (GGDEF)-like protein